MNRIIFLLGVCLMIGASPAGAAEAGIWRSDTAHGYERYWTENRDGARFAIWCPPSHDIKAALIGIDINGRLPAPDTVVRVELNRKLIKFRVGHDGYIHNTCASCPDNLTYFWHQMRSAPRVMVLFDDKRYAGFSLRGIQKATPHSVCASQLSRNTR
ncbi:hypothetical protein WNZ15_08505 [Roseibium sp. AS2]|uniref:hypothetical protein n=1 Tax=Roseibium sp. AS2 TaxID=3135781 RepID=UPI00317EF8EA